MLVISGPGRLGQYPPGPSRNTRRRRR